ncbi:MAG: hypothetical protein KC550_04905 [Nanoarchaeota archaeon]|nr:hypothetical protein [Nanoarchaeota archaeon]
MKNLKKYESFEPEEEWEEEEITINPNTYYVVYKEHWDDFYNSLVSKGYKHFMDINGNDFKNLIEDSFYKKGKVEILTYDDYFIFTNQYLQKLLGDQSTNKIILESFEPEEEWEEWEYSLENINTFDELPLKVGDRIVFNFCYEKEHFKNIKGKVSFLKRMQENGYFFVVNLDRELSVNAEIFGEIREIGINSPHFSNHIKRCLEFDII